MIQDELKVIEQLEHKYLLKFYHFMKFVEDEMLEGFQTKEKIKPDWIEKYSSGISNFSVGAERIVYSLFNGKGIGQPNSSPVGSDLFFEVEDAFIHIDLKTVQTRNIGDYSTSIFVGTNQNSYTGTMIVNKNEKREYVSALPHYYTLPDGSKKICLTYFVTILYEELNLSILNINLICMPNGKLFSHYESRVLKAGKNFDKTRFNFTQCIDFELLEARPKRIKVVYFNKFMESQFLDKLTFLNDLFNSQG